MREGEAEGAGGESSARWGRRGHGGQRRGRGAGQGAGDVMWEAGGCEDGQGKKCGTENKGHRRGKGPDGDLEERRGERAAAMLGRCGGGRREKETCVGWGLQGFKDRKGTDKLMPDKERGKEGAGGGQRGSLPTAPEVLPASQRPCQSRASGTSSSSFWGQVMPGGRSILYSHPSSRQNLYCFLNLRGFKAVLRYYGL